MAANVTRIVMSDYDFEETRFVCVTCGIASISYKLGPALHRKKDARVDMYTGDAKAFIDRHLHGEHSSAVKGGILHKG